MGVLGLLCPGSIKPFPPNSTILTVVLLRSIGNLPTFTIRVPIWDKTKSQSLPRDLEGVVRSSVHYVWKSNQDPEYRV